MAVKYFCDCCGGEVKPTSALTSEEITTINFINPATGKSDPQMACIKCTKKLKEYIKQSQKENKILPVGNNFNLKIK